MIIRVFCHFFWNFSFQGTFLPLSVPYTCKMAYVWKLLPVKKITKRNSLRIYFQLRMCVNVLNLLAYLSNVNTTYVFVKNRRKLLLSAIPFLPIITFVSSLLHWDIKIRRNFCKHRIG